MTVAQRDAVFGPATRKFHVVAARPGGRRVIVFATASSDEAHAAAESHRRFALAAGANISVTVEQDGIHVVGVRR